MSSSSRQILSENSGKSKKNDEHVTGKGRLQELGLSDILKERLWGGSDNMLCIYDLRCHEQETKQQLSWNSVGNIEYFLYKADWVVLA